jgi:zinc transporter ZupT
MKAVMLNRWIMSAALVAVAFVAYVNAHDIYRSSHSHDHHHHHSHDNDDHHHEHHRCSHGHDHDIHIEAQVLGAHTGAESSGRVLSQALVDGTIGSFFTSVVPIAVIPLVALFGGRGDVRLLLLTALAAGAIIADSLSHYPAGGNMESHDAHDDHHHDHRTGKRVMGVDLSLWYLLGFVAFFVVDGAFGGIGDCTHSSHSHGRAAAKSADKKPLKKLQRAVDDEAGALSSSRAMLSLVADFAHNVTDGAVLGISSLASPASMYRRAASLIAHELPHEVGDYAVLSQCGWSLKSILLSQIVTGLGSWIGCVSVIMLQFAWEKNYGAETSSDFLQALEAFVGGSFLYLGTVVLIADLHRQLQKRSVVLKTLVAVAFYCGVQALEVAHLLESAVA